MEASPCLITIGITCYNAEDTITRAVKSAFKQNWPNFEVIVVDDHSTDGSWSNLKKIADEEPNLKIVRHDVNKGYPSALNTILQHADGEFIAIFDDDDRSVPDRLEAQFERITAYEKKIGAKLILCYSNRAVVKGNQESPDHVAYAIGRSSPEPYGPEVADYLLGIGTTENKIWGMFGSCTLMARKAVLHKIGSFDENFRRCTEWDLAVRAAHLGTHFISVDRPLITQFKTQGEDKSGTKPLFYALMLRDKHRAYLDEFGLYNTSRMFAKSNYWGNKKRSIKSLLYRLVGYLLSPSLLTRHVLKKNIKILNKFYL